LQFRKDINGLRAIAVIAVVLFHFNNAWLPGGFAGVDAFFVISGFLMTGIIFRGLEQGHFSILKFYVARANRIIPALAVLCLVLLIIGWFYLTPLDYKALGKYVASSMGFLSNVIYWRESGYFDAASNGKWLLHTWSLSAEWQFYIVYPLILVAMRKFMSTKAMKATVLFWTVLGFIFCVLATYKWPDSAYYLLPTRAWEMMMGGVAYLYPITLKQERKKLLEWLGLALIITSYFLISGDNPWPGYLAIFPVLGSFLIIQAQRNDSFITSNIVFQKLGSWSYSIYLWHWPLVVAIYYFPLDEIFIYFGITLSVLLGYLSNKYIEKVKFRNDFVSIFSYLKCKPIYFILIIGLLGSAVFISNGLISRFSESELKVLNYSNVLLKKLNEKHLTEGCDLRRYDLSAPCHRLTDLNEKPSAIILGDSHSTAIAPGVNESLFRIKGKGVIVNAGAYGCIPLLNINHRDKSRSLCKDYNKSSYEVIAQKFSNVPIIILNRLNLYPFGFNENNEKNKPYMYFTEETFNEKYASEFETSFVNDMCILSRSNPVFILKPMPEFGFSIPNRMLKNSFLGTNLKLYISKDEYNKRNVFMTELLRKAKNKCGVIVLDATSKILKNGVYNGVVDDKPLYSDDNHLNVFGANFISSVFDEIWTLKDDRK